MSENLILSWDHSFPLEQYDDEPDVRTTLPRALVDRLSAWEEDFRRSWDYEVGRFERQADRDRLDQEFRELATALRALGLSFSERPWWRELPEPWWKQARSQS